MTTALLVGLFGVLGVLSRYGIDRTFSDWNESLPLTTFCINMLGCFLAGLVYAISTQREIATAMQAGLLVGFCGGFTTFSAYALQGLLLLEKGKPLAAMIYISVSPVIGLVAAFIPVFVARKFFS